MSRVHKETVELIEGAPECENSLDKILAVDAQNDTWSFHDVPADLDLFDELISRGIVIESGGNFYLQDPQAVRSALCGATDESEPTRVVSQSTQSRFDVRALLGLVTVCSMLVLLRGYRYPTVQRAEHVLSPGQAPYRSRYRLEELLGQSTHPTSVEVLAHLPADLVATRPITHITTWWIVALLGGDPWAADLVAAWLPVVVAVLVGLTIYGTAVVLTTDVRIGLAAVFLFGLTPIHVKYAGLGYLDYRLYQYLWLGLTLLCLTYLAVVGRERFARGASWTAQFTSLRTWLAIVGLSTGLAFSILAWSTPIIPIIPIVVYVFVRVGLDVRADRDAITHNSTVLVSLGGAIVLLSGFHVGVGWLDTAMVLVVSLTLGVCIVAVLVGETGRYGRGLPGLLVLQAIGVVLGLGLFRRQYPEVWNQVILVVVELLTREGDEQFATVVGGEFGLLDGLIVHGGVHFMFALAVLGWAAVLVWRQNLNGWLVMVVYGGVWLVLAVDQLHYVAHLSIVLAICGGVALVVLLSWLDVARRPVCFHGEAPRVVPSLRVPRSFSSGVVLLAVYLVIAGVGLAFVPVLGADVGYSDEQYRAVQAIEEHAASVGSHDPVILSDRTSIHMYNFLVSGANVSSDHQEVYDTFVRGEPEKSYQIYGDRVGYIVIEDDEGLEDSVSELLYESVYPEMEMLPQEENFQLLYAGEEVAAYAVVQGATIVTNGEGVDEPVRTTVEIGGNQYGYERTWSELDGGSFAVTVAYPGTYEIDGAVVEVRPADVAAGNRIEV